MTAPAGGDALESYLSDVTSEPCVRFCAGRSGLPVERVRQVVTDYAGEVRFALSVLNGVALDGRRVLEVGAGLGLLGIWLRRQGVALEMLEPSAGGFDASGRLRRAMLDWLQAGEVPVIEVPAEALDRARHGVFDVIFSVNVLEHIRDLEAALDGMLRVLAPGGILRHTCPNYAVPYEPHYAMPLVPFLPRAAELVVPRLRQDEVWRSLNFITYSRVVRYCRARRLACTFDRGLLAQAFARIEQDPAFRARRGRVAPLVARVLKRSGLLGLLSALPPRVATPMAFSCWER